MHYILYTIFDCKIILPLICFALFVSLLIISILKYIYTHLGTGYPRRNILFS